MAGSSEDIKQYRLNLFTKIHEIIFHGGGGYDYNTIYNMPVWLRDFTFHKLKEHYNPKKDENDPTEQIRKAQKDNKIQVPTYVTKASKK